MINEEEKDSFYYNENFMSIKRKDYEELIKKLHEAEKKLIIQSKTDIKTLSGLKPSRIILEFENG